MDFAINVVMIIWYGRHSPSVTPLKPLNGFEGNFHGFFSNSNYFAAPFLDFDPNNFFWFAISNNGVYLFELQCI
jgi:hypothetical protein